jgi:hypothetical protein
MNGYGIFCGCTPPEHIVRSRKQWNFREERISFFRRRSKIGTNHDTSSTHEANPSSMFLFWGTFLQRCSRSFSWMLISHDLLSLLAGARWVISAMSSGHYNRCTLQAYVRNGNTMWQTCHRYQMSQESDGIWWIVWYYCVLPVDWSSSHVVS